MDLIDGKADESRGWRRAVVIVLLAIVALALLLRVLNVGHVLTWDEAWNVHSAMDAAYGYTQDSFFPNFWRHPPAYLGLGVLYARVAGANRHGLATAMETISIVFSLGLILVLYMCGKDWLGRTAGLGAAFLMAVMPAARAYDTWIKQEPMVLFLCLLFLLFFFRKRYVLGGIFLGVALLTKEIAVFIPAALLLFLLAARRFKELKGFAVSGTLAALLSFWWYAFFSTTRGEFVDFFLGKGEQALLFKEPWYYYLSRLPKDLGYITLLLVAIALVLLFTMSEKSGGEQAASRGYSVREMLFFLLIWISLVYVVLSISKGKPAWMTYSALPAFALLGGWGFSRALKKIRGKSHTTLAASAFCLLLLAALVLTFLFAGHDIGSNPILNRAPIDEMVAHRVNEKIGSAGRVMMYHADASPTLMFYLDAYGPEGILFLSGEWIPARGQVPNYSVYLLDRSVDRESALTAIANVGPDVVVLANRPFLTPETISELDAYLRSLSKPETFDDTDIFDGRELHMEITGQSYQR